MPNSPRKGTVLAADQKLEFTGDDLDIIGVTCCELCGDIWKYEFECPVCCKETEAVGLHEPNWMKLPKEGDDEDKFECCECDAQFTKTVPGVYRMDAIWRLSCSSG